MYIHFILKQNYDYETFKKLIILNLSSQYVIEKSLLI